MATNPFFNAILWQYNSKRFGNDWPIFKLVAYKKLCSSHNIYSIFKLYF
jgi:hypothetical protein